MRFAKKLGTVFLSVLLCTSAAVQTTVQTVAAATTIQVLPLATYPGGTFTFPATAVPLGVTDAELTANVATQPDPLPSFVLNLEVSFDAGATWLPGGGASRQAGPKGFNRLGQPATTLGFKATFLQPTNPNRQVRGSLVLGGPCAASASVTLFP
jgi:hypothetical protein